MIAPLPGNVYWMDTNCIHLGCNDNVLKMLGMTREEYVGKTYEELAEIVGWTEGEAESFKRDDLEVLRTGIPKFNVEEPPLRHKDGKVLHYLTTRVPMRDEAGNIVGVAGISTDITDRKMAEVKLKEAKEKAEAAVEAKSRFLANISHDFITLLSIIMNGTNAIIAHGNTASKRLEYCNDIMITANTLLGYVQDILEVAQFDYAKVAVKKELVNLREIISEVIRGFNLQAAKKNIIISVNYSKKVFQHIVSDRHRIHRILSNLLANAIKFTETGEIKLKFSAARLSKDSARVSFSVADTGIGISKDKLGEIFEPFTRIQPSYYGHHKGIGLGLSIVREFIKQLDGKVSVDSEIGKGTIFYGEIACQLPKASSLNRIKPKHKKLVTSKVPTKNQLRTSTEQRKLSDQPTKLNNLHLLLVEDEPMIQKFTQLALGDFGCEVTIASNAKEAIFFATTNNYDLILLDIGLPDHDGVFVIQAIRADEAKKNVSRKPIVALTAHADEEKKRICLEAGLDIFCRKPLTKDGFLKICKQLCLYKK